MQFAKEYPELEKCDGVTQLSWRYIYHKLLPEHKEKPETPEIPEGKYQVIYADPPWQYSDRLIDGYGAAEHHYPTMNISNYPDKDGVLDAARGQTNPNPYLSTLRILTEKL